VGDEPPRRVRHLGLRVAGAAAALQHGAGAPQAPRREGNRYLAEPEGPPIQFVHRDCAAPVHLEVHCAAGHSVAERRDVLPRPGPGARLREVAAGR